MKTWINIFWLGIKELRSLLSDVIMLMLIVYSFSLAIYAESTAISESVHNASIAIVDEDNSALSGGYRKRAISTPTLKHRRLFQQQKLIEVWIKTPLCLWLPFHLNLNKTYGKVVNLQYK